jgi:EAL domain-containing protein (putative c-di-GMP-specific phosphodiesterase class I)/GGDEF domain-containing protein
MLGKVSGWRGGTEPTERAYDPQTGLPCGRLFLEQSRQAYSLARRQRAPLAALLLRLDEPGQAMGPSLAHPSGHWRRDGVLAVRKALRDSDSLGLLGDAELGVLLPSLSRPEDVVAVGQRVLEDLRAQMGPQGMGVTLSMGAALMPLTGGDAEMLFNAARKGAARSLSLGGDCLHFDDPELDLAAADRFRYEVDMRCGLLAGQFTLHYQPQADLDGTVRGAEALLRWLHPERGPVPPSEFIPFSESCGFIDPLSAWVLRRALRAAKELIVKLPAFKMSVNLSPRQFRDPGLVDSILGALREEGCPGSCLCVEVTESSALIDVAQAAETLQRLRDAGVKVALDDFGSGYASVGYLKQLPLDYVKLDRSLVQELGRRKDDERIAELVVSIAHQQGLIVIAEGVEDESQLEALRRVGCDQYQGYLMAKPQPLEQMENWLKVQLGSKNAEKPGVAK